MVDRVVVVLTRNISGRVMMAAAFLTSIAVWGVVAVVALGL